MCNWDKLTIGLIVRVPNLADPRFRLGIQLLVGNLRKWCVDLSETCQKYCVWVNEDMMLVFGASWITGRMPFLSPKHRLRNDLYCVEWDVKP